MALEMPVLADDATPARSGTVMFGEFDFRKLVEAVPAVVYALPFANPSRALYVSPYVLDAIGTSAEESMAQPGLFFSRLHPDDSERVKRAAADGLRSGAGFTLEYRLVARDGRIVWFRDHLRLVRDGAGHPSYWVGVNMDVSEWKATQNALENARNSLETLVEARTAELQAAYNALQTEMRKRTQLLEVVAASERRYRELFDAANDIIYTLDRHGRITSINAAADRIVGLRPEEMLGKTIFEALGVESAASGAEQLPANEILDGRPYEVTATAADGRKLILELSTRLFYESGEPAGAQGIARDVTGRKRVEDALRESQEFVQDIAQTVPEILYVYDIGERALIWANPQLGEVLGYTLADLRVPGVLEAQIAPDDLAGTMEQHARSQARGDRVVETEFTVRNASGDWRCVRTRSSAFRRDQDGNWLQVVGAGRDITDEKAVEQALRESLEEVRRSHSEMRRMADGLLNAQEEERKRVSRELHDDLNQRAAMLLIEFEALEHRHPELPVECREPLARIKQDLIGISDDIRRIAQQLHPAVLEYVGLPTALESYCAEFSKREGIRARFKLPKHVVALTPDISLCLYRIALEALRNVARHSRARNADVELSIEPDEARLTVADDGAGFDPEASKDKLGLGILSMSERARLVSGSFELQTRPGGGTRITVTVPIEEKPV